MQRQVMGSQHADPESRSQSLVQEVPDQLFILEIGACETSVPSQPSYFKGPILHCL